jgi:hypothetical protein
MTVNRLLVGLKVAEIAIVHLSLCLIGASPRG